MTKAKEIVSIHLGQAGLRIGDYCCQLFAQEHKINTAQEIESPFFDKNSKGKSIPNSIFVDLDPSSVHEIRNGKSAGLYDDSCFLSGVEDGACNYARGYYLINETILDDLENKIRQITENKSKMQGFLVTHSTGGGTGSGFTSRIMEKIADSYPKLTKISNTVLPGYKRAKSAMEVYNSVMFLHKTMDNFDVSFLYDNDAILSLCESKWKIGYPQFENINEIVAQTISSITASARFDGGLNKLLKEFPATLAPYPRLKYPIAGYAPLSDDPQMSIQSMSLDVLKPGNQLVDVNLSDCKCITCCYLYRGNIKLADANRTIKYVKSKDILNFADVPFETYKLNVIKQPAVRLNNSKMPPAISQNSACILINGTSACQVFCHLIKRYQLLRKQNAYIHWLIQEGLEENDLNDAEDDLKLLSNEYLQTVSANEN